MFRCRIIYCQCWKVLLNSDTLLAPESNQSIRSDSGRLFYRWSKVQRVSPLFHASCSWQDAKGLGVSSSNQHASLAALVTMSTATNRQNGHCNRCCWIGQSFTLKYIWLRWPSYSMLPGTGGELRLVAVSCGQSSWNWRWHSLKWRWHSLAMAFTQISIWGYRTQTRAENHPNHTWRHLVYKYTLSKYNGTIY